MDKTYQIFNRDSKELSTFISLNSVDFVVFSPPYWNLRNYGYKGQIGHKQSYNEYLIDMKTVFSECFKVLRNGRFLAINIGTVVSNEGMKLIAADFLKDCIDVGFIFRKDIIWHKPRGTTKWQRGATQFSQSPYPLMFNTNINHEYVLIFQKGERGKLDFKNVPKFNKTFIRKVCYSVWDIAPVNSPKLDEKHVAPYPEELPRRLIQLFTFKDEIVLDPFAGCGTANKVAHELGRKTIAVEMSKSYCTLIKNKLNAVKYGSYKEDIYNNDTEDNPAMASKEKMDKAYQHYLKAKKIYDKALKKPQKTTYLGELF